MVSLICPAYLKIKINGTQKRQCYKDLRVYPVVFPSFQDSRQMNLNHNKLMKMIRKTLPKEIHFKGLIEILIGVSILSFLIVDSKPSGMSILVS